MRVLSTIVLLCFLLACSLDETAFEQFEGATFRITLNYGRELSDAELDSIENSHPLYIESARKNKLYDLLVRKGIVSDQALDTSGLNFLEISFETPAITLGDMSVKVDTSIGREYLIITKNDKSLSADLGPPLLGDRFLSYVDIDDNGKRDLLLMEKSYVIGGYNFDLKLFKFD